MGLISERAYKRKRKSALQQPIVVQIKIVSIALTDLLIKLQNITITRFHLNTVGGKGWGLIIRCIKTESTGKLGNNILIFSGQKPFTSKIRSILHVFFAFFTRCN